VFCTVVYFPACVRDTFVSLRAVVQLKTFWEEHNVKVIALSCDDVESHRKWLDDITAYSGVNVYYPIIADPTRCVAPSCGVFVALLFMDVTLSVCAWVVRWGVGPGLQ
jgi:alkyl hydroperoxide reductase subunit AhpC